MSHRPATSNPAVLSYLNMRRAVGFIALALPFILVLGDILLSLIGPRHALPQPAIEPSISAYYYTVTGRFLVGGLCAIAMFLMSCQGYDRNDEIVGYLACAFALGVAFFPIANPCDPDPSRLAIGIGDVHGVSAALMFLTLAYYCLILFRKTAPGRRPTRHKLYRNIVYTICGWTIVGCMVVMTSLKIPAVKNFLRPIDPLLCFETVSLFAFGVAWLTKGEWILKDEPHEAFHSDTPPAS